METKRPLLIAEDEPIMRGCIREVLSVLNGYDLYEAPDGVEALEQIERPTPDLVVLDLLMPRMDGFGVLNELNQRQSPERTPKIVVLTALVEPCLVEQLQRLGADRVLMKPFRVEELLAMINELAIQEPAIAA